MSAIAPFFYLELSVPWH